MHSIKNLCALAVPQLNILGIENFIQNRTRASKCHHAMFSSASMRSREHASTAFPKQTWLLALGPGCAVGPRANQKMNATKEIAIASLQSKHQRGYLLYDLLCQAKIVSYRFQSRWHLHNQFLQKPDGIESLDSLRATQNTETHIYKVILISDVWC